MLTRNKTPRLALTGYGLVLPLVAWVLMAFAPHNPLRVPGVSTLSSNPPTLIMPIDRLSTFKLESGYGERMHPVLHVKRLHTGIDLVASEGVSVIAARDGVVVKAAMADAWGNLIVIRHDDTYSTSYAHLKSMLVKEGDRVQQGQAIGQVGHTGMSQQDHLHFELLKNNKAVDPLGYLPR